VTHLLNLANKSEALIDLRSASVGDIDPDNQVYSYEIAFDDFSHHGFMPVTPAIAVPLESLSARQRSPVDNRSNNATKTGNKVATAIVKFKSYEMSVSLIEGDFDRTSLEPGGKQNPISSCNRSVVVARFGQSCLPGIGTVSNY
jgi:hypothetical protein